MIPTPGFAAGPCLVKDTMQLLALTAMEPPVSLDGEAIRDEKVKLLRAIQERQILLQLADRDFYVAPVAGFELRRAAGEAAAVELKRYDSAHDLRHPGADVDRAAFLARLLNLS